MNESYKQLKFVSLIGVNKCGTSSLAFAMNKHPNIKMSHTKEPAFFAEDNFFYGNGMCKPEHLDNYHFYCFHFFPIIKWYLDASTIYSSFSECIKRLREYRPDAKIIILFRNPIIRAYSAWWHFAHTGGEKRTFKDAIMTEHKAIIDGKEAGYALRSYVSKGYYIDIYRNLLRYFPKEQILAIKSEEMFKSFQNVLSMIFNEMGLENREINVEHKMKSNYQNPIPKEEKNYLKQLYFHSIKDLEKTLGWNCEDWLTC